jgi:hypothetical protein
MSGMHLLPAYWTTNRTKKKKKKKINPAKYEADWRQHNKFLKSIRSPIMTLDEYIDYRHGRRSVTVARQSPKLQAEVRLLAPTPYVRETKDYPSLSNSVPCGFATKKERPVYTGNAVIGQAYNKGGLQVLSADEVADPMTGKRR